MDYEKVFKEEVEPHFDALQAVAAKYELPLIIQLGLRPDDIVSTVMVKKGDGPKLQAAAAILIDEPERAMAILLASFAKQGQELGL